MVAGDACGPWCVGFLWSPDSYIHENSAKQVTVSSPLKVLLVDDDQVSRTMMAALLRARGHLVHERTTTVGTTEDIALHKPDVVLLDVFMPGVSGDAVATLLVRSTDASVRPVVLLISAMAEQELSKKVVLSGADGYVTKGAPKTLGARLESAVAAARVPR
jgi:CheY-like chemotaxis protein